MWHVIPTLCGMLKLSKVILLHSVGMHDLEPPVLLGMHPHRTDFDGNFRFLCSRIFYVPGYSKTANSKLSLLICFILIY